ncbi:MAG: tRNA dihydrouridine synthase DusB [Hyphomicrobiales bacterium]|nr:tRNA dihydrouridine synthase DusB [Hyphomicrobiales bacterium]
MEKTNVDISAPIKIGTLTCRNRAFLAPMSGISDVPFRKLAWKFGAGLVFSEMVASEALVSGQAEMEMKALGGGLPIHAVQIAGRQAKWMALAGKISEDNGADLIDINMGCPARRVTNGLSGSALMRDPDYAMRLIEAVIGAVKIPVTLKMRLGWDDQTINAPQLAMRAQSAGIAMVSVHARTRCQFYKGSADWDAVRAVRSTTNLPLVINGDIIDHQTAGEALERSGADAVMIGRASYGAPWLAGALANQSPSAKGNSSLAPESVGSIILEHFEEVLLHYGSQIGIRQFRKHLSWYIDRLSADNRYSPLRISMLTSSDPNHIRKLINQLFCQSIETVAA